jgi:ATP-dependent helicase HrpA
LQAWPGGRLPTTVELEQDGAVVVGHPALVDTGDGVAVRVLASAAEQQAAMRNGTRRLLLLTILSPARAVLEALAARDKLALARDTDGRAADAVRDAIAASVNALVEEFGGPAWDEASFSGLRDYVAQRLPGRATDVLRQLADVHAVAHELRQALAAVPPQAMRLSYDDLRAQLADLVPGDAATASGEARLPHLLRYLHAMRQRLERLPRDIARDLTLMQRVHAVEDAWHQALDELPPSADVPTTLAEVKWMLEELRVSLFAQQLGTAHPVSEKRILQVVHARA